MRWPDDAGTCSAILSHLALRAEEATSADMPVVPAVVDAALVLPLTYDDYINALQRERADSASASDKQLLTQAHSRGVQTPGGI
jgi:hypothetical protein